MYTLIYIPGVGKGAGLEDVAQIGLCVGFGVGTAVGLTVVGLGRPPANHYWCNIPLT